MTSFVQWLAALQEPAALHESGAVGALLDVALAGGWQPREQRAVEVDGWFLLEAVIDARAEGTSPEGL